MKKALATAALALLTFSASAEDYQYANANIYDYREYVAYTLANGSTPREAFGDWPVFRKGNEFESKRYNERLRTAYINKARETPSYKKPIIFTASYTTKLYSKYDFKNKAHRFCSKPWITFKRFWKTGSRARDLVLHWANEMSTGGPCKADATHNGDNYFGGGISFAMYMDNDDDAERLRNLADANRGLVTIIHKCRVFETKFLARSPRSYCSVHNTTVQVSGIDVYRVYWNGKDYTRETLIRG